jgi:tetratricopeptide (TPR) repeat protein
MNMPNQKRDMLPLLQGGLLVLLIWLVYYPSLRGNFLWDDNDNVTDNQTLRSFDGLGQIWFEPGATQQYYPLTHTSFWLNYQLWGLHPLGYHVTNILCQAISAVLLWQLLRRLAVPGAWFGAALFALHPVGVESVAWITERKNTLSGIFFLAALLTSLNFWLPNFISKPKPAGDEPSVISSPTFGPWKFYWLTLVLYVCALLSKTSTIGLPAIIFLLVWWKRRSVTWQDVRLLLPFMAVGIGLGLITSWLEKNSGGATGREWNFSLLERCILAGKIFWFYPAKLLWPHPLMFMYPRWTLNASQLLSYLPLLAMLAVILVLWLKRNSWGRPVLFAVGYFIATIFPVMGFFNVYFFRYSFVCDHFQYLASMGLLALAGAGIALLLKHLPKIIQIAVPTALLFMLGFLAHQQTAIYKDRETLWRDSLAHNPASWIANNNLGEELAGMGRYAEATAKYHDALKINPNAELTIYNLGIESARAGNTDEAIRYYKQALENKPTLIEARINLGNVLDARGDMNGAVQQYAEAARIDTNSFGAFYNLGNGLVRMGNFSSAAGAYHEALRIRPESAGAQKNFGIALASIGHLDEAMGHFLKSEKLDPNNPDIHYCLGMAMAQKGNAAEAQAEFTETLRLNPNHTEARRQLEGLSRAAKQ